MSGVTASWGYLDCFWKRMEKWDYRAQLWDKAVSVWLQGAKHVWQPSEQCKTKFLWNQMIFNASWVPIRGTYPLLRINGHLLSSCSLFVWHHYQKHLVTESKQFTKSNMKISFKRGKPNIMLYQSFSRQPCQRIMYPHQYVAHTLCFWMLNQQCSCLSISLNLPWL